MPPRALSTDPSRIEDWEERLRSAGLRVTNTRLHVMEALYSAGGHRTAAEIGEVLAEHGQRVSRAAVFNALNDLTEAEIVMLADIGPGTARYELAETSHHHFVCRLCGEIWDMPCAVGQKPCLEAELPGATIDEAQVIFRGICAACQAAGKQT